MAIRAEAVTSGAQKRAPLASLERSLAARLVGRCHPFAASRERRPPVSVRMRTLWVDNPGASHQSSQM